MEEELQNLYIIARRSRDSDLETAARYYEMIQVKDPMSWEAYFYSVYLKAAQCKIIEIESAAHRVTNCIKPVLTLIRDHVEGEEAQNEAVTEVYSRCMAIAGMLDNGAWNHYMELGTSLGTSGSDSLRQKNVSEMAIRRLAVTKITSSVGTYIDELFQGRKAFQAMSLTAWKATVTRLDKLAKFVGREGVSELMNMMASQIQKYEPDYKLPEPPQKPAGGCYVATAVYGSYDCPRCGPSAASGTAPWRSAGMAGPLYGSTTLSAPPWCAGSANGPGSGASGGGGWTGWCPGSRSGGWRARPMMTGPGEASGGRLEGRPLFLRRKNFPEAGAGFCRFCH